MAAGDTLEEILRITLTAQDSASGVVNAFANNIGGMDTAMLRAVTSSNAFAVAQRAAGEALQAFGVQVASVEGVAVASATATLVLGAAIVGVGVAMAGATRAASDFDTMLVRIQNNTTMTNADVATMHDAILSIGASTGQSFDQLGQGFMHIENLGFSAADSVKILSVANESAIATGSDLAQTANVLANVLHEFGLSADEAGHAMGVLHLAAASGNLTLNDLVENGGRAYAMAANLHVPFEQVSAALSVMTEHGFDAAQSGTQVADVMLHIAAPSKAAKDQLEALGQATGTDLVDDFTAAGLAAKGLPGIINDVNAAMAKQGMTTDEMSAEWLKLIPNIRGGMAAMVLGGTGADDFTSRIKLLDDATKTDTVTQEAQQRMLSTGSQQMAVLGQSVQATAIAFGEVLLPPVVALITDVAQLANSIENVLVPAFGKMRDIELKVSDATTNLRSTLDGLFGGASSDVGSSPFQLFQQALVMANKAGTPTFGLNGWLPSAVPNLSSSGGVADAQQLSAKAEILDAQNQAAADAAGASSPLNTSTDAAQKSAMSLQEQAANISITGIKRQYDPQIADYQSKIDKAKADNQAADDNAKQAQAALKTYYEGQIQPLQQQLALKQQSVDADNADAKVQEEQIHAYYDPSIQALQDQLALKQQSVDLANAQADIEINRIQQSYQAQIDPLQQKVDKIQAANAALDQQAQTHERIASLQLQQIELAAAGDPAQRARIAAHMAIADYQHQQAQEQMTVNQLTTALPLHPATAANAGQLEDAQYKLSNAQDQLALLNLENPTLLGQAAGMKVTNDAQATGDAIASGYRDLGVQPLIDQLAALKKAEADAIAPIQQGINERNTELTILKDQIQPQITALQTAEQNRLKPIEQGIADRTNELDFLKSKLEPQIWQLTQDEASGNQTIQDGINLRTTELQSLTGPWVTAIADLKQAETDALKPVQDKLQALQDQSAVLDLQIAQTAEIKALNDQIASTQFTAVPGFNIAPLAPTPNLATATGQNIPPSELAGAAKSSPTQNAFIKWIGQEYSNLGTLVSSLGTGSDQSLQPVQGSFTPGAGGGHPFAGSDATRIRDMAVLGRASGEMGSQAWDGYCEAFIEQMAGLPKRPTALAAWNAWVSKGQGYPGRMPQTPGELVYFDYPGDGHAGHVGFYAGGGQFVSALDNPYGVARMSMADYERANNAPYLGSVPAYASGTSYHPGGMALVGEHGPELVSLPQGAAVSPIASGRGIGGTVRVEVDLSGGITVSGAGGASADMGRAVGAAIRNAIMDVANSQRTISQAAPSANPGASATW